MLNDSVNTTRQPGKYYTLEEARELAAFCKQHHVLLIPEIDMPDTVPLSSVLSAMTCKAQKG